MKSENEKKNVSLKEKTALLKRAVKDIHRISPGYLTQRCIIQSVQAMEQFIPIWLSGFIVDGISGGKPIKELIAVIVIFLVAGFLLQSAQQCFQKLLMVKMHRLKFYMDIDINEKILNMDYTKIEDAAVQRENDKVSLFNNNYWCGLLYQVGESVSGFCECVIMIAGALITASDIFTKVSAASAGGGIMEHLAAPLAAAVIILLMIIENIGAGKKMNADETMYSSEEYLYPQRIIDNYFVEYCGTYQSGKDIRLYGQKDFLINRLIGLWEKIDLVYGRVDRLCMRTDAVNQLLWLARTVTVYALVGFKAITGSLSAGEVVKDVQSFNRLWMGINGLAGDITHLNGILIYLKSIYDFLDMPDEKYMGTIPTEKRDDNEYEFEFKHVWFKYPGSKQFVLKDLNLKWRIGEKMALVGRNGCGKTTLVKLLCRLYDPTEGEITLNGIDIKKYKYEDYMALFSVVFQDSRMFSFSIADNVAAGGERDEERIEECVVRAGLGDRLREMEKGINTCLYRDFDEKGVEISGGEAQKLCLARAVYKGAPFIVLDEPTAALDPTSEYDIYTKFNEIVGTRTAVYISHRLSSCKFCDDITVMKDGTVVEKGSHEELLEKGGVYSGLWNAQAEYYRDSGLYNTNPF